MYSTAGMDYFFFIHYQIVCNLNLVALYHVCPSGLL